MRRSIWLVMALCGVAAAKDGAWKAGDLEVQVIGQRLDVVKGKQRATVDYGKAWEDVTVDAKAKTITAEWEGCRGPETLEKVTYTFDALEARLANWDALALHRKKTQEGWTAAAIGFARAAQLDPTWRIAAYNLASAKTRLGDKAGAIGALMPWLAKELEATYAQIASDPELQPLLGEAALVAQKAKAPGSLKVDRAGGMRVPVGYSPARGLVVRETDASGWGFCNWNTDVEVVDAKTGATVASIALVHPDDYAGMGVAAGCNPDTGDAYVKKIVAKLAPRFDAIDRMFADLGYAKAEIEEAGFSRNDEKPKATLPKAKLGIVGGKDGDLHVLRGNKMVATLGAQTHVTYVGAAKLMLTEWVGQNEDGCPTTHYGATAIPD